MKISALALVAMSVLSAPAFAKKLDANAVFRASAAKFEDLSNAGEIGFFLNPIFCVNAEQKLTLIYTGDFRSKEKAYLIDEVGNAQEVATSSLGLTTTNYKEDAGYYTSNVKLNGEKLFCVESAIQLESVGG